MDKLATKRAAQWANVPKHGPRKLSFKRFYRKYKLVGPRAIRRAAAKEMYKILGWHRRKGEPIDL